MLQFSPSEAAGIGASIFRQEKPWHYPQPAGWKPLEVGKHKWAKYLIHI